MTSSEMKIGLMSYFRYDRQMLCSTEYRSCDVAAFSESFFYEIECKISKSDLWNGEAKKRKHELYKLSNAKHQYVPNKFYVAVPIELIEEAIKWTKQINDLYGVIKCDGRFVSGIHIVKRAGYLHKDVFKVGVINSLMMRICAENINLRAEKLNKETILK